MNATGIRGLRGLRGLWGLRGSELIGRLTNIFQEYKGKDSVRLVWGHQGQVNSFAGIPLGGNSISVVASNPIAEKKRHLWKSSRDQATRELNSAHILTAFWKLNGPRILEKMKERRNTARVLIVFWKLEERRSAAHILTTFWKLNGSRFLEKMKERRRYSASRYKYPKNCCLMVDMKGDRNWMH